MDRPNRRNGQAGFTLTELLVSLVATVALLLAILAVVQTGGRVSRVEQQVTQMNQGLRASQRIMAQHVRMAGRGGLPRTLPGMAVTAGPSLVVRNNVGAGGGNRDLAPGLTDSPLVVEDTDVLAVRGVFESPLYQVNSSLPETLILTPTDDDPGTATGGTVILTDPGPAGLSQDLTAIRNAIDAERPEALVLVSSLGGVVYAVAELDPDASDISGFPGQVTVGFRITGGTHTAAYRTLYPTPASGGSLPDSFRAVSSVGILEEHRYYVREEFDIPGDTDSDLRPVLSRARMYPATEAPWNGDLENTRVAIADFIRDLQVALGFDSSLGGFFDGDPNNEGNDDLILEAADGVDDDWLFNAEADDPTLAPWAPPWGVGSPRPELYYVRLTTLGTTSSRERGYVAPPLLALEDHLYGEAATPANEQNRVDRMVRRNVLRTTLEMRNL